MANDIQTKIRCSTFFFIALLCMLSEKIVDGRRMSYMKNRELVPRKGTVKTIEVITSPAYLPSMAMLLFFLLFFFFFHLSILLLYIYIIGSLWPKG